MLLVRVRKSIADYGLHSGRDWATKEAQNSA
jgi:CRP-like cAMP-binding protein